MPFVILLRDRPGAQDLRAATRPAHLAHLEPLTPRILAAGPLMDDSGEHPVGSLIVIDSDDRAEVEALLANDPYTQAGLFESTEIRPWRAVFLAGHRLA